MLEKHIFLAHIVRYWKKLVIRPYLGPNWEQLFTMWTEFRKLFVIGLREPKMMKYVL